MTSLDLTDWGPLVRHAPPDTASKYRLQRLQDGVGPINVDYYSVRITVMPDGISDIAALVSAFRANFIDFVGDSAPLEAHTKADAKVWSSDNPLGATMHFNMKDPTIEEYVGKYLGKAAGETLAQIEDGAVTCTAYGADYWVFSTVSTWEDFEHPVNGNRQFGAYQQGDEVVLYTAGADRPAGYIDFVLQDLIWSGADKVWKTVMESAKRWVEEHGGVAHIGTSVSERVSWEHMQIELAGAEYEESARGPKRSIHDWANESEQDLDSQRTRTDEHMSQHQAMLRQMQHQREQLTHETNERIQREQRERLDREISRLNSNLRELQSRDQQLQRDMQRMHEISEQTRNREVTQRQFLEMQRTFQRDTGWIHGTVRHGEPIVTHHPPPYHHGKVTEGELKTTYHPPPDRQR